MLDFVSSPLGPLQSVSQAFNLPFEINEALLSRGPATLEKRHVVGCRQKVSIAHWDGLVCTQKRYMQLASKGMVTVFTEPVLELQSLEK